MRQNCGLEKSANFLRCSLLGSAYYPRIFSVYSLTYIGHTTPCYLICISTNCYSKLDHFMRKYWQNFSTFARKCLFIYCTSCRLEVMNPVPCTPAAPRCGYQNQGFCALPGICCLDGKTISKHMQMGFWTLNDFCDLPGICGLDGKAISKLLRWLCHPTLAVWKVCKCLSYAHGCSLIWALHTFCGPPNICRLEGIGGQKVTAVTSNIV